MDKYWPPGLRVFWRSRTQLQCGADPGVIVTGLTRREQRLLERVAAGDPRLDVRTTAELQGWAPSAIEAFLAKIPPEVFIDRPRPEPTPTTRYWSLIDLAAVTTPGPTAPDCPTAPGGPTAPGTPLGGEIAATRWGASVLVDGLDEVGLGVAESLAAAGVGRLVLGDPGMVTAADIGPRAYREVDRGHARAAVAARHLRPRFPVTTLTVRRGPTMPRVDLAVSVSHGVCDPHRAASYVDAGLWHLPVVVRELDVMVGPLISPTHGPCLRCVHLAMVDADERWPAIATQLSVRHPSGADPVMSMSAVALATHQAVAFVDGRETLLAGVSLHVDAVHPLPRHHAWPVHPRCGCDPAVWAQTPASAAPKPDPGADPAGGTTRSAAAGGEPPGDAGPAAEGVPAAQPAGGP